MVSATHVIMTVHPVLVLLPILGLLVLPCAPSHLVNGLRIVANVTLDKQKCDLDLCPQGEICSKAIPNANHTLCFLISCPNNTQNLSCENFTFSDLFAEAGVNITDSIHVDRSQTAAISSSPNVTHPLPTEPNVLISSIPTTTHSATLQIYFTTIATTNLQTTPTEKNATTDAVPKPAITEAIPTTPAVTSTTTTTPKPTTTTPKPTTTTPKPSPTTTSTTTTTTTVAQSIIPKQPSSPSPSGTNMSASISPSVPVTPSSTPSTKPIQTSAASSDDMTMPKTSLSPSVVASALPKDIPKRDQAVIEVAGDPLTSHLLNTSSLLAVLLFGLLFFVVTVALFLKQAYESYQRKDYTQVDYLINGMYSDSGV